MNEEIESQPIIDKPREPIQKARIEAKKALQRKALGDNPSSELIKLYWKQGLTVEEIVNITRQKGVIVTHSQIDDWIHEPEVIKSLLAEVRETGIIDSLTVRERTVLDYRHPPTGGPPTRTLELIANDWGVTRGRIHDIGKQAFKHIRALEKASFSLSLK